MEETWTRDVFELKVLKLNETWNRWKVSSFKYDFAVSNQSIQYSKTRIISVQKTQNQIQHISWNGTK